MGDLTAALEIGTDLSVGHKDQIALTGSSVGPKVALSPALIDFGQVLINQTRTQQVTLTNQGNAELVLATAQLPGAPFSAGALPATGTVVRPQSSVTFTVSVRPTGQGAQSADVLTLGSNDLRWADGAVKLPLSVNGVQGSLGLSPRQIAFPTTAVGAQSAQELVVTNTSALTLTGITFQIYGAQAREFSSPTAPPQALAPGQIVTVQLLFQPLGADVRRATLSVNSLGLPVPLSVDLSGAGAPIGVSCAPGAVDFQQVAVGKTAQRTVVCTNEAGDAVEVLPVLDGVAPYYTVTADSPTLAGGGSVNLTVTFAPLETGRRPAAVLLNSRGGALLAAIDLSGEGIAPRRPTPPSAGCAVGGRSGAAAPGGIAAGVLLLSLGLRRRPRKGSGGAPRKS